MAGSLGNPHKRRLYGITGLRVILVLQARISIFETVASDKLQVVRAKPDKLYKSLETRSSRWTVDR